MFDKRAFLKALMLFSFCAVELVSEAMVLDNIMWELRTKLKDYKCIKLKYRFFAKFKKNFHLLRYRVLAKIQGKTVVHFLHIGKTGGNSVKYALKNAKKPYINATYLVFSHHHSFRLKDTLVGEKSFFFVRDPIDRFVSGFYSRKRKGMPKIYNEWKPSEKIAFDKFKTPNQLAISLSSKNEDVKNEAIQAMKNIGHVNTSYWDWFENERYFLSRIQDIIFVGTQKNLDEDFLRLKRILNLPKNSVLPKDKVDMHKNPEYIDKHLDSESIQNLKRWYSKDFQFLRLLKNKNLL